MNSYPGGCGDSECVGGGTRRKRQKSKGKRSKSRPKAPKKIATVAPKRGKSKKRTKSAKRGKSKAKGKAKEQ
jgi:hypothetical protein